MCSPTKPLQVLLLKSAKEEVEKDPYVQVLEENDYTASCVPVLGFEFVNLEELHLCLSEEDSFSCIVITSQRAVEAIVKATANSERSLLECWKSKRIYVVGKATGQAVRNMGLEPIGEDAGNAEELVKIILKDIEQGSKPVLFPCGNLRKETIPERLSKAGLQLKNLTVYQTSRNAKLNETMAEAFKQKTVPEYIVFFSPSGVEFTKDIFMEMDITSHHIKFVAIGPSTHQALVDHGHTVYSMSTKPTPRSLLQALNTKSVPSADNMHDQS